jgi:hypothetical protein
VSAAASWTAGTINGQITKVGRALADIGQSNTAAMSKLFESQNDTIKAVDQRMGDNHAVTKAMDVYGPTSRSVLGCGSVDTAGGAAYTAQTARAGAKAYTTVLAQYSRAVSRPSGAYHLLSKILGKPGEEVGATDLFGGQSGIVTPTRCVNVTVAGGVPGQSGTKGRCQDASYAVALVNPLPRPVLDAAQASTPKGKQYRVLRRLELSQLSLPSKVLGKIHSWHTANTQVPLSIRKTWINDRMPSPPPWNAKGQVSPESLLDAQVALRYEDPTWMRTLNGRDNGYALLREIAMNQVIGLEMSKRRMILDEYIASMLAAQNARSVRTSLGPKLDRMYQGAQSSSVSQ